MSQGEDVVLVRDEVTLRGTVAGAGPTVLLLHAGAERRTVWAPVTTTLVARGLRTVAWDLRGHGESSGEATALRPVADDVAAMIRREPGPVVVVGASLGGMAALQALSEPGVATRVAGVVLVDVVPGVDPARVRAWLGRLGLLGVHRELVDDLLAHGPGLLAATATIAAPLLLVRGGAGSPLLDAEVARLAAARPDLAVARVPEAGHLVARNAPDALAGMLAARAATWLSGAVMTAPPGESPRPDA